MRLCDGRGIIHETAHKVQGNLDDMVKIREAIVVEGRYDKNTLSQIVDAPIFQTDGFGIFRDREKMRLLRRTAEKLGLIVFTDSDGAGFVIRNKREYRKSV